MRLSAMGDVALIVPVLQALSLQNPTLQITVISRPFFAPFFEAIPHVSFFAFDEKKRHKGILGLWRLYQDLKPLKIDAFADLHSVIRSKIIRFFFWINGKQTVYTNKSRDEKKALIRTKNKIFKPLKTIVAHHTDTFLKLGYFVDLTNPVFPEKAVLPSKIKEFIGQTKSEKIIGIAPFAQYKSKIYPLDLMQKVIDQLALNPNTKILLFGGGQKEMHLLETLALGKENVKNVAGKLNLKQELALISNLSVMLSMDSANAHLAAMFGIKVVTLWGATHPYAGFAPFNQPLENCLTADRTQYPKLPTSVYGKKTVPNYHNAMRTISVADVVQKVTTVLYHK